MASTKPIKAEYSAKLDGMAAYIRTFLSKDLNTEAILRTHKGIADFCYKNLSSFKEEFLHHVGLQKLKNFRRHAVPENHSADFALRLSEMDGECVFLLKDTLADSHNVAEFSEKYFVSFGQLIKNDSHFLDRAKKLSEYVASHSTSHKIIFVDLGFQFTFSLFCSAAMRHFGNTETDFYSYSIYPWLQTFFKDKYFSEKSEAVLDLELEAIKNFQSSLQNKAAGAFVGFAIGDALGFPIAGIDKSDVLKFINQEITGFTDNPKHPFFHHLKSGQYTENTNLLMISAQHLIKNRGFVPQKYQGDLSKWGKKILTNPDAERWAGPTAINAVKNLIGGKSYFESGSTKTESCSATYRVVPL